MQYKCLREARAGGIVAVMSNGQDKARDLQDWIAGYAGQGAAPDTAVLREAAALVADISGDLALAPDFTCRAHRRNVLDILAQLKVDAVTLAAATVYLACLQDGQFPRTWRARLDPAVAGLVDELWRVAGLKALKQGDDAEGLRRLLLALVKDLRVVLVILADQLARLRAVSRAPAAVRRPVAEACANLYAPLANRLGIWQLKWELEDLAFRYRNPKAYKHVARLLDERRAEREQGIAAVVAILKSELAKARIHGEVAGRPKHIYSIWNKMQRKNLGFEEIYDVRAVRVLVNDIAQCYAALGLVHAKWQPVPGEFDDYIASPKANQYQSLHTAVIGPDGKALEIQIRSFAMHEHAELGVAAHWRYKEGGGRDPAYERKLVWLRQLLEGQADEEFLEQFRTEAGDERVYALTPQGKVVDLRAGATVLDFAYHIHTDVGHRCRGAKVNGRIVPLTYVLRSGEQVEILTAKQAAPSRDWMVPALGYLATGRARQKVRQWFRKQDYERNRDAGRALVEKELQRVGVPAPELKSVARRFNFNREDALYAAVGAGEITPVQVANAAGARLGGKPATGLPATAPTAAKPARGAVRIEGVGHLMHHLARCCKPVPPDDIIGYITRGRGVSVHRRDCRNVLRSLHADHGRLVEVAWGDAPRALYGVDVRLQAYDRKGLVHDISGVLTNAKARVQKFNSTVDPASGEADIAFTVQVENIEQLSGLLNRLARLPNVTAVQRVS